MNTQIRLFAVLLLVVWLSSFAAAVQKPASVEAGVPNPSLASGQDVITASDAGGGHLSTSDILMIVLIVLAVIGLAAIL
jgi:hypothetical protein